MPNERKTSRTPREIREKRKVDANKQTTPTPQSTTPEKPVSAALVRPSEASSGGSSRAAERIKERKQEQRRQQLTTMVVIAVVIIALLALAIFVVNVPAEAPIPDASTARYDDVVQNRTEDGYPRLGDPSAPIQVAEFSSFDCTTCATLHDQLIDGLVERVKTGKMSLVYIPLFGTGSVTNGRGAALASICVAEQGAFWEFHDALFSWQEQFGNQSFTNNRIQAAVSELGLDSGEFNGCISSGSADETISTALAQVRTTLTALSTPAFTINGILIADESGSPVIDPAAILEAIDARLDTVQAPSPESTAEATQESTAESTTEATDEATDEPTEAPTEEATEAVD
jgi:protein-disulfide isomerase